MLIKNGTKVTLVIAAVTMTGSSGSGATALADKVDNGNSYNDCPDGFTLASANIVKDGAVIGIGEMRWPWACSGEWTKVCAGAHELLG
ncbi:hypothetical protein M8C13_20165 [Crossiella sp. SN42]|uniref:hypothetical protein n=1 Tax=Crossiella sp. SN42 TaxID=2944808 RepID=UPI00207C4788|nr:hypothetical protein [Crossiella sp. SN42]MCO1578072.1 hypothetical protein [Crossiella sp. SN42]